MDGNGRWAKRQGLPRLAGHRAGAEGVRTVVRLARQRGIPILTLYAFSSDNWRRPVPEVTGLLRLFERFLRSETAALLEQGIALVVLGRRDRLPASLRAEILRAEMATNGGTAMRLRIAIDHSGRDAILGAARRLGGADASRERFAELVAAVDHDPGPVAPVDLLIRTGGERRLSDFLLWEAAYAELLFLPMLWPDFGAAELEGALADYAIRERRFGALPETSARASA
jgi:undecaprenyl diphosphate synthase